MSFEPSSNRKAELQQLWGGGQVPPLTPEEVELSLKLWQKIQKRKQKVQKQATRHQFELNKYL